MKKELVEQALLINKVNNMNKINRIGETSINNFGNKMTIIEYYNNKNSTIQFDNGYISYNKKYIDFLRGKIKSPYDKSVYNIGYLGEGRFETTADNKPTIQYLYWKYMLMRCYDGEMIKKEPTYIGCTVCDDWLNFQNFAEWFDQNYYEIENERMCLDKDILVKRNKIYSPQNCVFVPIRINNLFTKCDARRGDLPIGVRYDKARNKYASGCNTYLNKINKYINLGRFNNPIKAFEVYKEFKENHIKQVAEEYKLYIPKSLYDALYNYKVEITD